MDFLQDPEVPEAVKQFEALVADGAGERKYSFEKSAIFETKKTSNELQVREGWQSIFLHKNKRGWLPWRRFDKIFLSRIFFQ